MEEISFIPTDEDKRRIEKVCDRVISILEELKSLPEKALAITSITESFNAVYGVKMTAIFSNEGREE